MFGIRDRTKRAEKPLKRVRERISEGLVLDSGFQGSTVKKGKEIHFVQQQEHVNLLDEEGAKIDEFHPVKYINSDKGTYTTFGPVRMSYSYHTIEIRAPLDKTLKVEHYPDRKMLEVEVV